MNNEEIKKYKCGLKDDYNDCPYNLDICCHYCDKVMKCINCSNSEYKCGHCLKVYENGDEILINR